MRTHYEWSVSERGDIIISKVITHEDDSTISETITHIPAEALRYAVLNATGQGDGFGRSGKIET